jgi:hypothetical protein
MPSELRPDWAMVGWRDASGQVCILASKTLTTAQLDHQRRRYDFETWDDFRRTFKPSYTLSANLDDFILVKAATYIEAIAQLVRTWDPDRQAMIEADTRVVDAEIVDDQQKAINP